MTVTAMGSFATQQRTPQGWGEIGPRSDPWREVNDSAGHRWPTSQERTSTSPGSNQVTGKTCTCLPSRANSPGHPVDLVFRWWDWVQQWYPFPQGAIFEVDTNQSGNQHEWSFKATDHQHIDHVSCMLNYGVPSIYIYFRDVNSLLEMQQYLWVMGVHPTDVRDDRGFFIHVSAKNGMDITFIFLLNLLRYNHQFPQEYNEFIREAQEEMTLWIRRAEQRGQN